MHIPDGFLDVKTIVTTTALSTGGAVVAWNRVRRALPPHRIPLLGVSAGFVFAAQMLNFPVVGGTSGHLMGAVLLSVLLGPYAAVIAMGVVLFVQCVVFADGGMLALGANVFNMAIVGVATGYPLFRLVRRLLPARAGLLPAAAIASWVSIMASALCCAGELAWSRAGEWHFVFTAMGGIHAIIGLGEAAITCLVIAGIHASRPDLLDEQQPPTGTPHRLSPIAFGFFAALGLVLFISPFASTWPDGLETVASSLGFSQRAIIVAGLLHPFPDYAFPGVASASLSAILAGTIGVLIVSAFALTLTLVVKQKKG